MGNSRGLEETSEGLSTDVKETEKIQRRITRLTDDLQNGKYTLERLNELAEAYRRVCILYARMERFEKRARRYGVKKYLQLTGLRESLPSALLHRDYFKRQATFMKEELDRGKD